MPDRTSDEQLQHQLNTFTNQYLEDVTPLIEDGDFGHASRQRLRLVKFYLGYPHEKRDDRRDARPDQAFALRLAHPDRARSKQHPEWPADEDAVKRGKQRRQEQQRLAKKAHDSGNADGFAEFDGKTVAEWMIPWLKRSRAAGWQGSVVSGVRTPDYSEHLCYAMCGSPTCPGRCAGRGSNHNMLESQGYPYGALDVSDYLRFAEVQRQIGSPLKNDLPIDRVHFSVSGH